MTTAMKQRVVMIGRLTALPYKLILLGVWCLKYRVLLFYRVCGVNDIGFELYGNAIGKAYLTGHYDCVTIVDSAEDFVGVVELASEFDFVIGNSAVVVNVDITVSGTGLFDDGTVGHNDVFCIAVIEGNSCEHAGENSRLRVCDLHFGLECARRGVDIGVNSCYFTSELFVGESVEGDVDRHTGGDLR